MNIHRYTIYVDNNYGCDLVYQSSIELKEVHMNWLNAFELICNVIVTLVLGNLIRKRDYNGLFTFGTAALVGFSMELLAVSVTDIYFYSDDFWLSIGKSPHQFPVFGGLMWGGLTVYGMQLAGKLGFGRKLTALCTGMFIVTLDILLDVVAIRLDGGFWTWAGIPISTEITQSSFMGVIWVNFLVYMIKIPSVVWLTLLKFEKVREKDWAKQTYSMFLIALGGVVISSIGSLAALFLNSITNDWFACIAFQLIWISLASIMAVRCIRSRIRIASVREWDIPMFVSWLALYTYCIAAIIRLGLDQSQPWFLILGFIFALTTLFMSVDEPIKPHSDNILLN